MSIALTERSEREPTRLNDQPVDMLRDFVVLN
jgi:hypothetical protein